MTQNLIFINIFLSRAILIDIINIIHIVYVMSHISWGEEQTTIYKSVEIFP